MLEEWYNFSNVAGDSYDYDYTFHLDQIQNNLIESKKTDMSSQNPKITIDTNTILSVTLCGTQESAFQYRYSSGIEVTDLFKFIKGSLQITEIIPFLLIYSANSKMYPVNTLYLIILNNETYETMVLKPNEFISLY